MQALEQRIASNGLPPGAKNAVGELFILHDRQHGMFEIMRDAVGRLAPPQDPAERGNWESCVMCALRSDFQIPSPSLLLARRVQTAPPTSWGCWLICIASKACVYTSFV